MVDIHAETLRLSRALNPIWLGYRYFVTAIPSTLSLSAANDLAITAAGISEIVFPSMSTNTRRKIPSLSTQIRYVPSQLEYGELVFRAPVTRNKSLHDRIIKQKRLLQSFVSPSSPDLPPPLGGILGAGGLLSNKEDFMIGEFENKTAIDILPINVWIIRGAQATEFIPASANAQRADTVPMDELRFVIEDMEQL